MVPCLIHRTSVRGGRVNRFGWDGNRRVLPWVELHRIDRPQLSLVAFKLDGAAHLARGVGPGKVHSFRLQVAAG